MLPGRAYLLSAGVDKHDAVLGFLEYSRVELGNNRRDAVHIPRTADVDGLVHEHAEVYLPQHPHVVEVEVLSAEPCLADGLRRPLLDPLVQGLSPEIVEVRGDEHEVAGTLKMADATKTLFA